MRDCYLVRGRMRSEFHCEAEDHEVLELLRRVMRAGVSFTAMNAAVDRNSTLEDRFLDMGIDRVEFRVAMGHPIIDVGAPQGRCLSARKIHSGRSGMRICAKRPVKELR